MTATDAPEITDEELRERAAGILAEERKPPADRWYRQTPYTEEDAPQ